MVGEGPVRRDNWLDIEHANRIGNPILHKPLTCVQNLDITSKGNVEDEGARICDIAGCFNFAELLKIRLY